MPCEFPCFHPLRVQFLCFLPRHLTNLALFCRSIPVAMTWGYVFALMPLLSINLDTVFGKGSFIRRIPFLELSTPEEYLASIAASPDGEDIKEAKTAETMEGAEYVGDLEEAVFSLPDGGAAANEETPLLAKESL